MQETATEFIRSIRKKLGDKLCILAHHYQHDHVVRHADYCGDSLELARKISPLQAEHIIMCGVYFMAESAAILARNGQAVHIPDEQAGCFLADASPARILENKLQQLSAWGKKIIPLAYVNTSAAVKAICNRYQGSVCTSANASTMLDWALKQGDGVLFLPDKNLAQNTADKLNIPQEQRFMLNLKSQDYPRETKLFIWPGSCVIHHRFKPEHIREVRQKSPQAKIIVHPECTPEVVQLSDASGSTSQIIKYVQQAEQGSIIYVGTEINMVNRLGEHYRDRITILPLLPSQCSHMAKITEQKLAALLRTLPGAAPISVNPEIKKEARAALQTMLDVCS